AIALGNIVGKAENVFLIAVVPLHRKLDRDTVAIRRKVKHRRVQRRAIAVQVLDEGLNAAVIQKDFLAILALVVQLDAHAGIEESQLAKPVGKRFEAKLDIRKYRRAGKKIDGGAGTPRLADFMQRRLRLATFVNLLILLAVAINAQRQHIGECVDDRNADTVQTAGDL